MTIKDKYRWLISNYYSELCITQDTTYKFLENINPKLALLEKKRGCFFENIRTDELSNNEILLINLLYKALNDK